ncbi:Rieske (2Fe-2S) protein [Roseobacter sp. HKCCA0882]|uniref:Rieske (2Fe-2S) protein n=1 Tax=Roseobacter sp. HKCCA0882 TaxID=3120337 RepID=UPI0030EE03FC
MAANHHLEQNLLKELESSPTNILYISHEHQDHFDKKTLKKISKYIDHCIIPQYEDKFLFNELSTLGLEVVELEDQVKFYLNDNDYVELLIVDRGATHDSAAVLNIDNSVFVNQNDCKIFDRLNYFRDVDVDFYSVQFSGANWHPVCYEISEECKAEISRKKINAKLTALRRAIETIKPKYYIPSAGPAIFPFLDPNLSLGEDNIFIHQSKLKELFLGVDVEMIYLTPGSNVQFPNTTKPINPPTREEIKLIKERLHCEFDEVLGSNFDENRLIGEVNKRLEKVSDLKFEKCPIILFDWGNNGLEINLNNGTTKTIDLTKYLLPEEYMKISASEAYFHLMSDAQYRWQDVYLSLRASVQRSPDVFNTFVNIFISSDVTNIRSAFKTTIDVNEERIVVVDPHSGNNFEIQRFCPHNGADLKDASIDESGNLICPRHSWLFDLNRGGQCDRADVSLKAKPVVDTISLCENISVRLLE